MSRVEQGQYREPAAKAPRMRVCYYEDNAVDAVWGEDNSVDSVWEGRIIFWRITPCTFCGMSTENLMAMFISANSLE